MINTKRFLLLVLLLLFLSSPSISFSQNSIIPIDASGVQNLINDTDCPLLIIAAAAWCAPCREELPILNRLYLKYRDQGLQISALSLDLSPSDMQRLIDQMDLQFTVYWGGDTMASQYNIFGLPTILIVKDGKIQERIIGKRSEGFLEKTITHLMESCTP
jgi:thiol-disulfide isomerase/thioredoxin